LVFEALSTFCSKAEFSLYWKFESICMFYSHLRSRKAKPLSTFKCLPSGKRLNAKTVTVYMYVSIDILNRMSVDLGYRQVFQ
jgi:hypothetical protein